MSASERGTAIGGSPVAGSAAVERPPILAVHEVTKSFGGVHALDHVTCSVRRGSVTALIGPNGAGKTTLFNVVTGFVDADHGRIDFEGEPISKSPPNRIAGRGLVRTFQTTKTLRRMTVLENMLLAVPNHPGERIWPVYLRPGKVRSVEEAAHGRAMELLERFKLIHLAQSYAGVLSGGQRKLLELARILMLEPTMIMLDEPMAGINPVLGQALMETIVRLRDDTGITVLFIEHDMGAVMSFAEEIIVMADGAVLAVGDPASIRTDSRVIDAYLGTA